MASKVAAGKVIQQATPTSSRAHATPTPANPKFAEPPTFVPCSHLLGNEAMLRLLDSGSIQAKLRVSRPGDAEELEADRIAGQVMSSSLATAVSPPRLFHGISSGATVHRKCACAGGAKCPHCEEEVENARAIHRKAAASVYDSDTAPEHVLTGLGSGRALDPPLRKAMEARFRQDLSTVRVHHDSAAAESAKSINALAFTSGSHIYFGSGSYAPHSQDGQRLLAHELVHVVQQKGLNGKRGLVQRQKGKQDEEETVTYPFQVPKNIQTATELFHSFNLFVFGQEAAIKWMVDGKDVSDAVAKDLAGKKMTLTLPKSLVAQNVDPAKKRRDESKKAFDALKGSLKTQVKTEADKRFSERSGTKPDAIKKEEEGKSQMLDQALEDVLKDMEKLQQLPPEIKKFLGPESTYKPQDYEQLLRIAEKLKQFTTEDLGAYKLLTIRATDNLNLFEKSVDMFLARRAELKKALDEQQAKQLPDKKDDLRDAIDEKWKTLDEQALANMSEGDRLALARQKTDEIAAAQLKHMKDHPGETIKDFAKSATLMNTPETFSAIGKDIQEAANGDANSWARWAAGTGAGSKISGWLLAVAGVLYVASWLTGIGELATIAAAAGILLGTTLTLSAAERELRIKAASQAKTPEEFKRNVELAAAAEANLVAGLALIVVAAVLHFTAKTFFPETMKKVSTSLKNFRERIRLKGSVGELRPQIKAEMGSLKGELAKRIQAAKQEATNTTTEVSKLTTEQFAAKLDKGASGTIFDQSKVPADQKVNFGELMKSKEGRAAIEEYRGRLIDALNKEIPAEIDRLGQEYESKIDEFLKDVDAATNGDDLKKAADKIEDTLTEEHAKAFIKGAQERITQQKADESIRELNKKADELAKAAAKMEARKTEVAKKLEASKLAKNKNQAEQTAKWAADNGIMDQVESLIDYGAKGSLRNPKQLVKLIELIGKGGKEHIQALNDARARLDKGHQVSIEAEADVVDHTEKQAVQHKNIATGVSEHTLSDNVKKALEQLAGTSNPAERPPAGYQRLADIRITQPDNPHFNSEPAALEKYLKDMKALSDKVATDPDADVNAKLDGIGPDLVVRITNKKGTFNFRGPNLDLVK